MSPMEGGSQGVLDSLLNDSDIMNDVQESFARIQQSTEQDNDIFGLNAPLQELEEGLNNHQTNLEQRAARIRTSILGAKRETFLEQASAIEKMDQDIVLFEDRKKSVEEKYGKYGDSTKWPPHISVQYNQEIEAANTDLLAVVSQRNNLVKEYNAASEKFNWAPFETELNKPREIFQEYK